MPQPSPTPGGSGSGGTGSGSTGNGYVGANTPCKVNLGASGFTLDCSGTNNVLIWNARESTVSSCPINEVEREPYPRALVTVPNTFSLLDNAWGPSGAGGSWTPAINADNIADFTELDGTPLLQGLLRDIKLGLRSRRLPLNQQWFGHLIDGPVWEFEDRSWNGGTTFTSNVITTTHTYQTASVGLTKKGRSFDQINKVPSNFYDLPAYYVRIFTLCGHEWRMTWQESVHYWKHDVNATCTTDGLNPDGSAKPGYAIDNCSSGAVRGVDAYKWEDRDSHSANDNHGWYGIDLTKYGYPLPFAKQYKSKSFGTVNNNVYWDATAEKWLYVPVVEVQSVLRNDECANGGTCPSAETGSLDSSITGGSGGILPTPVP